MAIRGRPSFLVAARLPNQLAHLADEVAAIIELPDLDGSRMMQDAEISTYTLWAGVTLL
jgi:adenine phosphoribosyltransferase